MNVWGDIEVTTEDAVQVAEFFLSAAGITLTPSQQALLRGPAPSDYSHPLPPEIEPIAAAIERGFFHRAAKGETVCSVDVIRERLGKTVEENCPAASRTRLLFDQTFWTFSILLLLGGFSSPDKNMATHVLRRMELRLQGLFFPMMTRIPPHHRQAQRAMIVASGAAIDVDDFLYGGDVTKVPRGGCLVALAVMGTLLGVSSIMASIDAIN